MSKEIEETFSPFSDEEDNNEVQETKAIPKQTSKPDVKNELDFLKELKVTKEQIKKKRVPKSEANVKLDSQVGTKTAPKETKAKRAKKLSPEEEEERRTLILKLQQYGISQRFGKYLASLDFKLKTERLVKLSTEELQIELERVQIAIQNRGKKLITTVITTGASIVEGVTQIDKVKKIVNLKGLSSEIEEDDQFLDLVEELSIEHSMSSNQSVETRFAIYSLEKMAKVALKNKADEKKEEMASQIAGKMENFFQSQSSSSSLNSSQNDVPHTPATATTTDEFVEEKDPFGPL